MSLIKQTSECCRRADGDEKVKVVSSVLGRASEVVAGYFMSKDMLNTVHDDDNMVGRPVLGIVASRDIPRGRYPKLRSQIVSALSSVMRMHDLDVMVLNDASAALKYNVLQHSDGIYASSSAERVWFEDRAMMEYLDFQMAEELMRQVSGNG